MARGKRLSLGGMDIAIRARKMIGFVPALPKNSPWEPSQAVPIRYHLGRGGRDPTAEHPGQLSYGRRVYTCDCSGFTSWACGLDRYQSDRRVQWLSTDGVIDDATGPDPLFEIIDTPEIGALVVYGDYKSGGRKREGHIGVVTRVPAEWDPSEGACWDALGVTHCSSSASKRTGAAIAETGATLWFKQDGVFLRRT